MAEKSSLLDERSLECAICLQILCDPRLLPCSHTFCGRCIKDLAKTSDSESRICCPTCRQWTAIPEGGPGKFQQNVFADMCKRLRGTLPETLSNEKVKYTMGNTTDEQIKCFNFDNTDFHGSATVFCEDCAEYLCSSCQEVHPRLKVFKAHKLVPVKDITPEAVDEIRAMRERPRCQKHQQEIILYCDTCKEAICSVCCIVAHKTHECREISTVALELKSGLDEASSILAEIASKCDSVIGEVEVEERKTTTELLEFKQQLEASVKEVTKRLQAEKTLLEQDLESSETRIKTSAAATKKEMCSMKEQVDYLLKEIQQLCTNKCNHELQIAIQAPAILEQIRKLEKTSFRTVKVKVQTSVLELDANIFSSLVGKNTHEECSVPIELQGLECHLQLQSGNVSSMAVINQSLISPPAQQNYHLQAFSLESGEKRIVQVQQCVTSDTLLCSAGDQLTVAHATNVYKYRMQKTGVLSCVNSFGSQGRITGLTTSSEGNVLLTTVNPAQIKVYSPEAKLVKTLALPTFPTCNLKAVASGGAFAVLLKKQAQQQSSQQSFFSLGSTPPKVVMKYETKLVWVGTDCDVICSFEDHEKKLMDITEVPSKFLIASESSNNSILLFDDSGNCVKEILRAGEGVQILGPILYDRTHQLLCIAIKSCSQQVHNQAGRLLGFRSYEARSGSNVPSAAGECHVYRPKASNEDQVGSHVTDHIIRLQLPKLKK